jgi:hypothetical protein
MGNLNSGRSAKILALLWHPISAGLIQPAQATIQGPIDAGPTPRKAHTRA